LINEVLALLTAMRSTLKAALVLGTVSTARADAPVAKVLSMISDLEQQVIKEGQVAQKEYEEFSEWCEDRARNLGFEIKTGTAEAESLKAAIAEESATIEALNAKSDELSATIATDEADLAAATHIRASENGVFLSEEKDLVETIDMLHRATGILEREMQGGAASMLQASAGNLAQAFAALVQASAISSSDAARLTAFVQSSQKGSDADEDEAPGAPAATVYGSHSGDIVATLQDLTEKAEAQLAAARNTETANLNNFQTLEQSLEDAIKFANADLDEAKAGLAASAERKATATGDLDATTKDLAADTQSKASLHHDCMTKASTFEAETRSRGEELKAMAEAKNVIKEATGAALSQVSLIQVARSTSGADQEAVRLVRELARKDGSVVLSQLASQLSSAMHSQDPFGKIKGLISDMIERLEAEASADATHKAYCDKELAESNTKKSEKTNEIKKLTTRIDRMTAQSSQLKEEVAALQGALVKLAKSQAEMDRLRREENAAFSASKAELDKALTGIKLALKILNEYYATKGKGHTASEGASSGIIGLLEVCEADFSKNLAQITSDEDLAVSEYEQTSKDNEIEKTAKTQDLRYKAKESKSLDKFVGELTADRTGVQAELDAVLEYLSKIHSECDEVAETYANRKAHRESEIAGLKTALQVLESETAFIQKRAHRQLRGH